MQGTFSHFIQTVFDHSHKLVIFVPANTFADKMWPTEPEMVRGLFSKSACAINKRRELLGANHKQCHVYFSLYTKPIYLTCPTLSAGTQLISPKHIVPNNIIKLKSADC